MVFVRKRFRTRIPRLQSWNSRWLISPCNWLLAWRIWEWLVLWCVWQAAAGLCLALTNHLLCLLGVFVGVALQRLSGAASMLSSHIADLRGLSRGEVLGVSKMCVDELLVLQVDEWAEEEERVEDESETPEWDELDQPVRDEG